MVFALQITSPNHQDKVFTYISTPKTWSAARSHCLDLGGDLATIKDSTEQEAIANAFKAPSMWIGLNDMTTEGTFVWVDGSDSEYRKWASGSPGTTYSNLDCVELRNRPWASGWQDTICTDEQPFLCAKCGSVACIEVCLLSSCCCVYIQEASATLVSFKTLC
jgi:hypothetical protein